MGVGQSWLSAEDTGGGRSLLDWVVLRDNTWVLDANSSSNIAGRANLWSQLIACGPEGAMYHHGRGGVMVGTGLRGLRLRIVPTVPIM